MSTATAAGDWRLARSPALADGACAAVAFALTLALLAGHRGSGRGPDALGCVLAAVACFPLLARRRAPLGVLVLTTAASATLNGFGYALGPPFGPTLALFFVAADDRTQARIHEVGLVVLGLGVIHVAATRFAHRGFPTSPILFAIVVWGAAWLIGDRVRQRRQRTADLTERAHRSERETARERRLAVAEERTRIARDLHDSAAHAINVILVQAGAARLLQERDPETARAALSTIEDVARETIGEIDQLIRGLREAPADGQHEVEPPTGLAAIGMLAERHRATGLAVEVRIAGQPRPLAPGLDQAAYRIVQESLTNAARHGGARATVEVVYAKAELELTVSNPQPADDLPPLVEGHGILGMRERAALLGGRLEAGPAGGGFRVHARLPYASGTGQARTGAQTDDVGTNDAGAGEP
jgi:signal transduction histidine kinase